MLNSMFNYSQTPKTNKQHDYSLQQRSNSLRSLHFSKILNDSFEETHPACSPEVSQVLFQNKESSYTEAYLLNHYFTRLGYSKNLVKDNEKTQMYQQHKKPVKQAIKKSIIVEDKMDSKEGFTTKMDLKNKKCLKRSPKNEQMGVKDKKQSQLTVTRYHQIVNILQELESLVDEQKIATIPEQSSSRERNSPVKHKDLETVFLRLARIKEMYIVKEKRTINGIQQHKDALQVMTFQNKDLQKQISQLAERLKVAEEKAKEVKIEQKRIIVEQKHYVRFFFANIMQSQFLLQEYLTNVLQKTIGKFDSTRLVYLWNSNNPIPIHPFIDNLEHLLFLVTTQEEYHIAAYTQKPFDCSNNQPGMGIIISLTNRRPLFVKPNSQAITYEEDSIVFGMEQLKIKGNYISSNLGVQGGCYQSGSEKADIFFGRLQKEKTNILQLEVFQLIF